MLGFFKKKDTRSLKFSETKKLTCFSCGLYKHAESPKMEPFGDFKKKIMIIGEFPSDKDDQTNKPFQGKQGRMLERALEELEINLFEDCVVLNAVNCHPGDRQPSPNEVKCCRDVKVLPALEEYKPKLVIALGGLALTSMLATRWKAGQLGGMHKWSGYTIPDQDFKTWFCPVFHPTFVENLDSPEVTLIWKRDLARAVACLKKPFPIYKEPKIHFIDDLEWLREMPIRKDIVAFDYETTGRKPQAAGHRIASASIAYSEDEVVAFLMPEKKSKCEPFIEFLQSDVRKVAANLKFEDTWSHVKLQSWVRNWYHDTMLMAHVLDNRPGTTSLKFQAYVQFGITNYEEDSRPYLETPKDSSSNAQNKIFELLKQYGGKEQLLTYNAIDSILEYRLAMQQLKMVNELTERI